MPAAGAPPRERLLSLDVYRGLCVIAMMLVDWTGSWESRYAIFDHAKWLGVTLPDFIFPSLLFVMGVAVPFSLSAARATATSRRAIYLRILRRALLLFALGLVLNLLWDWEPGFAWSKFRVMGVLQRYALVYPVAAVLYLRLSPRQLGYLIGAILLGYWALMTLVPVPGFGAPNLALPAEHGTIAPSLATWIDKIVLRQHSGFYYPHDPEGLLTTLPAIATGLIGVLTGVCLQRDLTGAETINRLFAWGVSLVIAGYLWGVAFPLSKKLWTSSFVLFMGGSSLLAFAALHWRIDLRKRRRGIALPLHYGANALAAIMVFTFIDNVLRVTHAKDFVYARVLQPWLSAKNAAWVYSVVGILLLSLLFRALYRRRLFLRV